MRPTKLVPDGCMKISTPSSSTRAKNFSRPARVRSTPRTLVQSSNAAEAELLDGPVQLGPCHAGILQRHGAHPHQPIRMLGDHLGDTVVDEVATVACHFG